MRNPNFPKLLAWSAILVLALSACNGAGVSGSAGIAAPGSLNENTEYTVMIGELEGQVLARQQSDDEFAAAAVGYLLLPNGQIQTMADGRARLDFPDQTIVRVGPESLFTLDVIEEQDGELLKRLFLQFGKVWIVLQGGEMEIDTESGVASVRGSYLSVDYDEDTGQVYVTCLEGACTLEGGGQQVVIGAGQTALIEGAGDTPHEGTMSEQEIQEWLDQNPEAALVLDQVPGSIGNFVWQDLNGDGRQDEDEPGLPDVTVKLHSAEGDILESAVTDEDGYYLFESLFTGEYFLEFISPEGLVFTLLNEGDDRTDNDADADGATALFALAPGEHNQDLDAGLLQPRAGAVCPLTGQEIDDEALLALRPIFISISIFPQHVRPVTGINSAPVVFENIIDAGQTRLQALFYCGYPEVLPQNNGGNSGQGFDIRGLRSGRLYYAELAKLFGAGLIYSGASGEVQQEIGAYSCTGVTSDNKKDIGGAGLDVDRLKEVAANCQTKIGNTDLAVWQFGPAPSGGEPVAQILMRYNFLNQTRWIYESSVNGYVRYMNGTGSAQEANTFEVFTDALTGDPVVRQNVLILIAPHTVLNSSGTIVEFDLADNGGYGWLMRDGMKHKVCWSAVFGDYETPSNRYRPFIIKDCSTGEPVPLAYGQTWVHIVDTTTGFEWKGEDWRVWHFQPQFQP